MGRESEISGSLKNLNLGKNSPPSKLNSAYSRPSNTLVPIEIAHDAINLSSIILSLVEKKGN